MKKVLVIITVFILGFLSSFGLSYVNTLGKQAPFAMAGVEIDSPGDWIDEQNVHVYRNKVVVDLNNVMISSFANTNSMDPLLDAEANGLEIRPVKDKLRAGDIISYKSKINQGMVIHRIAEIEEDEEGTYYVMKGDNSLFKDIEKVRFEQIEGVLVGILY